MNLITHAAMSGSNTDRELLLSTANTQRDRAEVESWFDLLVQRAFAAVGRGRLFDRPGSVGVWGKIWISQTDQMPF
jgi:hypothetical protein